MDTRTIPGKADITVRNDGILLMQMHPKSDIDIDAAKEITELASEMIGSTIHANMVDISKMTFMSGAARKYFGDQDKSTVVAVAIIMNSTIQKALVNLYLKINRPKIPTKMFDNQPDAEHWLKERIKEA